MQLLQQSSVLGLPIDLMDNYGDWLADRLRQGIGTHVVTLNAEMAISAEANPQLAQAIQSADLVIPDGAGVVLYLRLRGKKIQRCPGIELAEATVFEASRSARSVFLFGGKPGIAAQAAERWQAARDLKVVGIQHGYLDPADEPEFLETLRQTQPDLILVGLGVPRQEFWIQAHRQICPRAIWIGVGGSFDIWSGSKTRAPGWLANNNLEWVYRLYQEPWRWRRMSALPLFAWKAIVSLGRSA
jgi:N-acetylglucosaminyldiphosphoundecaprenol N-acetyl-beta-D-mannosaminyltransferase